MNTQQSTDIFGIPVPSTDRFFLALVVVHILISLVCVLSGLAAMLSDKGGRRHSYFGRIYFYGMLSAFATVIALSLLRWPHNIHLLIIGSSAALATYFGFRKIKSHGENCTRSHTVLMGASYVLLLTGFYVDNGKNLPFWNQFPTWVFYVFPSVIGIPILLYVLRFHPLNRRKASQSS
jgi:hypothetical protein